MTEDERKIISQFKEFAIEAWKIVSTHQEELLEELQLLAQSRSDNATRHVDLENLEDEAAMRKSFLAISASDSIWKALEYMQESINRNIEISSDLIEEIKKIDIGDDDNE